MTVIQRPHSFFKYRPWNRILSRQQSGEIDEVNYTEMLLSRCEFYCQPPNDFDDPHDSFTGPTATGGPYDLDRYLCEKMSPISKAMQNLNAKKEKDAKKITSITQLAKIDDPEVNMALSEVAGQSERKALKVLSLSSVSECELMWASYADNHRGICLEFAGEHDFFDSVRPVNYSLKPPMPAEHTSEDLAFFKSLAWKHQNEWRLLSDSEFLKFPSQLLRRVILGYRFPESEYQLLVEALLNGGHEVIIDQMQRIPSTYNFLAVRRRCTERHCN